MAYPDIRLMIKLSFFIASKISFAILVDDFLIPELYAQKLYYSRGKGRNKIAFCLG